MSRLIDADALKDELELADFETDSRMFGGQTVLFEDSVFKIVDSAPTISPDEVRGVGEWEDAKQHGLCRCSVCKDCYIEKDYITQAKWRYCPNCGARLGNGGTDDS